MAAAASFTTTDRMRQRTKHILLTLAATFAALLVGFIAFLYSGVYPIAANKEHLPFVSWILTTLQENAVQTRAQDVVPPPLDDPELLSLGIRLYEQECVVCHGAPGVRRDVIGRGLNPNPPRLATAALEWTDAQLYWIIKNGLKMAGMPSFSAGHSERDLWALTAMTRALPRLDPQDYGRMLALARQGGPALVDSPWTALVRREEPLTAGDPERGQRLIEEYGCGSCHVVPGVPLARGKVGAPLTDFGERHYIAGNLINRPVNLAAFIMEPEAFEPGTAMPDLNALPEDAWDMAAYLLTLGAGPELGPPHPLPKDWIPLPHGEDPMTVAAPSPSKRAPAAAQ